MEYSNYNSEYYYDIEEAEKEEKEHLEPNPADLMLMAKLFNAFV